MDRYAPHVDLERPLARPLGLSLLVVVAAAGFAQGLTPKLWNELAIQPQAPTSGAERVAAPLREGPPLTPPAPPARVAKAAPRPAAPETPAESAAGNIVAAETTAQDADTAAADVADAGALPLPAVEEPPYPPEETPAPVEAEEAPVLPPEPVEGAPEPEAPPSF